MLLISDASSNNFTSVSEQYAIVCVPISIPTIPLLLDVKHFPALSLRYYREAKEAIEWYKENCEPSAEYLEARLVKATKCFEGEYNSCQNWEWNMGVF